MTTKAVPDTNGLKEMRCSVEGCGKFLGYENLQNGLVIIKCHNCKTPNIRFSFTDTMPPVMTAAEILCNNCSRFLFNSAMMSGTIKVKCRTCKTWHQYTINNNVEEAQDD
jgi:phage FluMu protein Com